MKINGLLLLTLVWLSACKQDPVNIGGGLHTANGQTVLFTNVSVYTVTSKKVSGGSTTRSGFTNNYLSVTDLATGKEINKIKIGDQQERVEFLGSLGGRAWFFSYDPAIGLHSRNAQTLAVEQTAKNIIAQNPLLSAGFTQQGYEHGLDSSGKYLFATTKDGYHYLIDPQTLLATKTDERTQRRFYSSGSRKGDYVAELNDSLEISYTGGTGRKNLVVEKKQIDLKSYLFFSHNGNPPSSKNLYYKDVATDTIAGISFIDPMFMVNPAAPANSNNKDPLLRMDNTVFVLSKNLMGNDFHWLVSAVDIPYNGTPRQLWQQPLLATEKLGWSDKEIRFVGLSGGKLALVFANSTVVLDAATGKLVWEK